jgi:DNA polymerase III alpha subunit (gram-positive type)
LNRYICFDTETGGTTLDTSLFTACFVALDENLNVVDELDLLVKPDNDQYVVTAQALTVNHINIIAHDGVAIQYKTEKPKLYQFLQKNSNGGAEKLTPIGHGIYFDILRIKQDLIGAGTWDTFVSYRTIDTSIICQFLRAAKLFPDDVSGSLGSLVSYFNLSPQGELHTARTDTLQTVAVLKELLKIVKK